MNEENLKLFGFWWVCKRKRMQSKYDEACADLKACAVDLDILRADVMGSYYPFIYHCILCILHLYMFPFIRLSIYLYILVYFP
jgi:hypothetical protein